MADISKIGASMTIRGKVFGEADLHIEGSVAGEVEVQGELVIESTGLVGASVSARSVIVRGAVKGDVVAEDRISLEEGAKVDGDLRAPNVAIAEGASYRGNIASGVGNTSGNTSRQAIARLAKDVKTETKREAPAAAAPAVKRAAPAPVMPTFKKKAKGVVVSASAAKKK